MEGGKKPDEYREREACGEGTSMEAKDCQSAGTPKPNRSGDGRDPTTRADIRSDWHRDVPRQRGQVATKQCPSNRLQSDIQMVQRDTSLFIMFSNVDIFSLDKRLEMGNILKTMEIQPQIIALQEVKPKNYRFERTSADYLLDGYDFVEQNLFSDMGRGLIIYVKKLLKMLRLKVLWGRVITHAFM